MRNILEVKNLRKNFKEFTAVDDISFELRQGEILGFLGPNGAGKTTTIQMLLGLLTPNSGEVNYFEKSLFTNREEILERVNFSSTYINFPWELKVKECLLYISYLYKINNRKKRIEEVVEMFNISKLMDKKIVELSEGQKTKINLAKSFLNNPEILLLDEPTASLDPDTADEVRKLILKRRKESEFSVVFTSHNMAEIEEVCDRVIFMKEGKILANDTPENLAKTINISHIKLMPVHYHLFLNFCKQNKFDFETDEKHITIHIKEEKISELLNTLAKEEIAYDEISIKTPTLEDYFISISRDKDEILIP